ncbi:O-antigen ligase C-terminal domain-containing protein [Enterobacter ludwigii]|jgi:O-antigen polymerase|nr:O-antigen ligase C-terminal domain-containing protein [Enterobacter ludwigii]
MPLSDKKLPARARSLAPRPVLLVMQGLFWLVIMHLPWPNNGDYGMNLPMNPLTWSFISLFSLYIWLMTDIPILRVTPFFWMVVCSAVLFTLPVLWALSEGIMLALPRLLGIWGGVMVYLTLLQSPFREKETVTMFYFLAGAAVIETIISLMGFYCPPLLPFPLDALAQHYKGYAPGIFQQVNVTASFLATGLAPLLFLLADRRQALVRSRAETGRLAALGLSIIIVSAALVLFHSRIGWIGGITAAICTSVLFGSARFRYKTTRWRRALIILLPVAGGMVGAVLLNGSVADSLRHDGSNHQRFLTLDYTLRMIALHPFKGWGLGMFEPAFQNFMAALPFANPSREMMQHPHNEILFIWAEGGVLALAGGLFLLAGWYLLYHQRKTLWQWEALLTTLPILLHTQVEFPLYYSVPHFFALLLMLAAAENQYNTLRITVVFLRKSLVAVSLYGIILCGQLFISSIKLGEFETGRLAHPESVVTLKAAWLMQMRYKRDVSLLHLSRFNHSGNMEELEAFAKENGKWIEQHMEEDAYNDQINVLLFLNRRSEARELKQRAHRLMPWDDRFAS